MKIIGIIPARGGSKGVRRKNLRPLAGRPLIAYSIESAQQSKGVNRLVCSTDDSEIAAVARSLDCPVQERPFELAEDTTPMKDVVRYVLDSLRTEDDYFPEVVAILQPTAPLRTGEHIDAALNLLLQSGVDSVVSVIEVPGHYHPDWQMQMDGAGILSLYNGNLLKDIVTRRQDLSPTYVRNGAIYVFRTRSFYDTGSFYGKSCVGYKMDVVDSVNIDSGEDFSLAELRLRDRKE